MGFEAIEIDISEDMIGKAVELDSKGKYFLVNDGNLGGLQDEIHDLILSAFTFDNIPTMDKKVKCLAELKRVLKNNGRIVNLVSSPLIYTHEWASFSTKEFPANKQAKSGDKVKIIMTDVEDRRPVEDVLWSDEAYQETYQQAGLEIEAIYRPLGKEGEPYPWVNETTISPWVIYVLKRV